MSQLSGRPTSLYQAIAARLEELIRTDYHSGDYLPSEKQLTTQYGVSRHTLRHAVDELVSKGLIQRRHGIGMRVLMRPYDYPLHAQARFSQNLLEQGQDPSCECLLAMVVPAEQAIAAELGCQPRARVIHLRTLRRVNNVPVCIINHFFADVSWWPKLQQFRTGSLHHYIHQQLQHSLSRIQTRISIRLAQPKECRLLEINPRTPLMCIRTLNKTAGGEMAEYSIGVTRGDMIELTLEH